MARKSKEQLKREAAAERKRRSRERRAADGLERFSPEVENPVRRLLAEVARRSGRTVSEVVVDLVEANPEGVPALKWVTRDADADQVEIEVTPAVHAFLTASRELSAGGVIEHLVISQCEITNAHDPWTRSLVYSHPGLDLSINTRSEVGWSAPILDPTYDYDKYAWRRRLIELATRPRVSDDSLLGFVEPRPPVSGEDRFLRTIEHRRRRHFDGM
jgi:hypothetical protein